MIERLLRIGAACVLVLAVSGCLFDTRDAEQPDPGGDDAVPLDDPLAPFEAIKVALATLRDANYERAISTNFVFSPTQDDSLDTTWGGRPVYENWTKDVEMDVLGVLLSESRSIDVEFTAQAQGGGTTTFQRFDVRYVLTVVDRVTPTDTTVYEGRAYFDHRNEGGNWRLTFWDEIETVPNRKTWGFLKGTLRNP
jgi:hypothetical protein